MTLSRYLIFALTYFIAVITPGPGLAAIIARALGRGLHGMPAFLAGFIAGDLIPIARTQEAYIYENPRALPRVLLATESQQADFASMISTGQWPDV